VCLCIMCVHEGDVYTNEEEKREKDEWMQVWV
jgi:hypothetical protein